MRATVIGYAVGDGVRRLDAGDTTVFENRNAVGNFLDTLTPEAEEAEVESVEE